MAKKKSAAPKHVEPEDESQDVEEQKEPETEDEADDEPEPAPATMSKADACRAALAAGIETAEKAMEFTRSKFGVEIKSTDFTLYKSKAKKVGGTSLKTKPGRKPREAAEPAESRPAAAQTPASGSDMIDDLAAVKHLVQKLGAEQVRKIVGLFE